MMQIHPITLAAACVLCLLTGVALGLEIASTITDEGETPPGKRRARTRYMVLKLDPDAEPPESQPMDGASCN